MKRTLGYFILFLSVTFLVQTSQPTNPHGQKTQVAALSAQAQATHAQSSIPAVRADLDFGRMPLYFIANRGQLDERVAYYVQGKDKTIYFAPEGLTIALAENKKGGGEEGLGRTLPDRGSLSGEKPRGLERQGRDKEERTSDISNRWVVKLDFVRANPDVWPVGMEKARALISYFKGKR